MENKARANDCRFLRPLDADLNIMFRFISPDHFLPICLAGLCKKLVNRLILITARSPSFLLLNPCRQGR